MSSLPLLSGRVVDPHHETTLLRANLADAQQQIEDLRQELDAERRKNRTLETSISEIRRQLHPLHAALCGLFGELDNFGPAESQPVGNDPKRKVWESWIQKFGASSLNGRMISALLDHHSMTAQQLRVAMQCGNQSVYDTAARLNKLGLLGKNGGKYSLKEL